MDFAAIIAFIGDTAEYEAVRLYFHKTLSSYSFNSNLENSIFHSKERFSGLMLQAPWVSQTNQFQPKSLVATAMGNLRLKL